MARCRGPAAGSYVLEDHRRASIGVCGLWRTSPGSSRETVKVELRDAREGRRRLAGLLKGTEGADVLVEVDGEVWRVPLNDIAVARLAPQG